MQVALEGRTREEPVDSEVDRPTPRIADARLLRQATEGRVRGLPPEEDPQTATSQVGRERFGERRLPGPSIPSRANSGPGSGDVRSWRPPARELRTPTIHGLERLHEGDPKAFGRFGVPRGEGGRTARHGSEVEHGTGPGGVVEEIGFEEPGPLLREDRVDEIPPCEERRGDPVTVVPRHQRAGIVLHDPVGGEPGSRGAGGELPVP